MQLGFRMGGSAVMDGGKYTVNISPPYCEKEVNKKCSPHTQKMFDVRGCEYCNTGLPFAYGRTSSQGISIQYPNELTAYAYDKNIATVKIKYCPMCGKKLKEDDTR